MCRQKSSWWFLALLLLVLFFSARTIWGDETVLPSSEPAGSSESTTPGPLPLSGSVTPIDPWSNFEQAWSNLKEELTGSQSDSEAQSILLHELQTEVDGLRSSSQESTKLYTESEANRMTERQEAIEREAGIVERLWAAERAATRWRSVAAVFGAVAVVELVLLLVR